MRELPAACAFPLPGPAHILCLRSDKSIFGRIYYDWGALFTLSWHRCSDLTSCLVHPGSCVPTSLLLVLCPEVGLVFCSPAWCLWPRPGAALPLPRKPVCWTRCVMCLLPFQPAAWKVATRAGPALGTCVPCFPRGSCPWFRGTLVVVLASPSLCSAFWRVLVDDRGSDCPTWFSCALLMLLSGDFLGSTALRFLFVCLLLVSVISVLSSRMPSFALCFFGVNARLLVRGCGICLHPTMLTMVL